MKRGWFKREKDAPYTDLDQLADRIARDTQKRDEEASSVATRAVDTAYKIIFTGESTPEEEDFLAQNHTLVAWGPMIEAAKVIRANRAQRQARMGA